MFRGGVMASSPRNDRRNDIPLGASIYFGYNLALKSDSVHDSIETSPIALEILRAKSDTGASLQCVCRSMALPYS
jgi:hypothetical protein